MTEQCNLLSPHSSLRLGVITDFFSQNGKNIPQETNHNGQEIATILNKNFQARNQRPYKKLYIGAIRMCQPSCSDQSDPQVVSTGYDGAEILTLPLIAM